MTGTRSSRSSRRGPSPGVEVVEDDRYRRTIETRGATARSRSGRARVRDSLAATIRFPRWRPSRPIAARIRRVFDLDADIETIAAHFAADPFLRPLVAQRPGLRVPGAWDGFELAVRAMLGQQITVVAARRLIGRLVAHCGEPFDGGPTAELSRSFPPPERVAAADLARSACRARAGRLSRRSPRRRSPTPSSSVRSAPSKTPSRACARIRGIGDWTAQYIAMRALREPDAFPRERHRPAPRRRRPTGSGRRPRPSWLARSRGDPGARTRPSTSGAHFLRRHT